MGQAYVGKPGVHGTGDSQGSARADQDQTMGRSTHTASVVNADLDIGLWTWRGKPDNIAMTKGTG